MGTCIKCQGSLNKILTVFNGMLKHNKILNVYLFKDWQILKVNMSTQEEKNVKIGI